MGRSLSRQTLYVYSFSVILHGVLVSFTGSLYPYPGWGSPYESADHYWPMYNITDGFLEDLEGAAHTVVYNGGKIVKVPQLEHALSLDGKDDYVDTGGFNADCVTKPSTCRDGFTLTFWLKVYGSGYIMSSGSFTNHRNGPGYQLYYHQSLKRFKFMLETRDHRWSLLLHEEVGLWTHMAFTWNIRNGLRYYEDGNLSTFTNKPEFVSPLRQQNYTPIITLARPSNILRLKEYGKFEISQFAIWLKELSAEDIAGVHRSSVVYDQNNVLCCHHKSVSPCHSNPCYDPDQCRQLSQSHGNCICPNVNLRLKTCKEKISGECEDKSTGCKEFAAQPHYCQHRKMRKICPRSCSYCAPELPSTTVQPTLNTGSTLMSRVVIESKGVSTQPQSSIPYTEAKPTLITYATTSRNLTTVEASVVTLRSEGFFSGTGFVLVLGFAAVAVLLIVGAAIILYRRRKMQLKNFKSPVDADKLQSNSIFDQHSNYCSNPKLFNYEVPRNRMEFIEELEQGNALLFEYDAFIIYSSKDEEWVRGTLLPTLEDKHGFKCCIHYRDFMPGVFYRQNMVNSVYASKKTVAVVSKNFFNSGFCESEFEYALLRLAERRDDSLIVIKLDDIDTRKLPLEVRKRSYIDCPNSIEKETWETKLVKSLNFKTR
ncbi:uncharacterized protein [Montipora capricornis]|uniref:uncharacterized protein isoform X2 n=1 Tax=Montipora capricornis TaxID=246305 RepID=UPI0035F1BAD5